MTTREEAALAYVQYEILSYLDSDDHPCDTLRGILDWWLYRQRLANGPQMVRDAVDALVREGRLFELKRMGAEPIYAAKSRAFRENHQLSPPPTQDEE